MYTSTLNQYKNNPRILTLSSRTPGAGAKYELASASLALRRCRESSLRRPCNSPARAGSSGTPLCPSAAKTFDSFRGKRHASAHARAHAKQARIIATEPVSQLAIRRCTSHPRPAMVSPIWHIANIQQTNRNTFDRYLERDKISTQSPPAPISNFTNGMRGRLPFFLRVSCTYSCIPCQGEA